MTLSASLADATGVYYGTGQGAESGPFVSRIVVSALPNGGAALDYEATSREHGVQHVEHSLLVAGADGCDRLYIAHSESPFVTVMKEGEADSGRFEHVEPIGPYVMAVVIEFAGSGELSYAWWWAAAGEPLAEQSKAIARRRESATG
jgi:hypothetical protein